MRCFSRKALLLLLCVAFGFSQTLLAQQSFWKKVDGPAGVLVSDFVETPDGALLAAAYNGILRSDDAGKSWQTLDNALGAVAVQVWAFDASEEGTLYVAAQNGVFKAGDNENWDLLSSATDFRSAYDIVVNAGVIYVTTDQGVFSTADEGQNWESIDLGLGLGAVAAHLVKTTAGVLYTGTTIDGIYKSLDNGQSWVRADTGVEDQIVRVLYVDDDDHLWLGTNGGGVFKTVDAGDSWQAIGSGITDLDVRSFVSTNGMLFAGASSGEEEGALGGIYRLDTTTDTWLPLATRSGGLEVRSMYALNDGALVAGTTGQEIFRSENEGEAWLPYNMGLNNTFAHELYAAPSGRLFVGTMRSGLYRSDDNGNSWGSVHISDLDERVSAVAEAPSGEVFALTNKGNVYRSSVDGNNWTLIDTEAEASLQISAVPSGTILISRYDSMIRRSEDGGNTWTDITLPVVRSPGESSSENVRQVVADGNGVLYTGVLTHGVFRSTDDGVTWEPINDAFDNLNVSNIAVTPNNELIVAMRGESWREDGLPAGIYASTNGGESWTAYPELPDTGEISRINSIVGTPDGDLYVLAFYGVNGGEWIRVPYRFKAETGVWEVYPEDVGLAHEYVLDQEGHLVLATFGNGIYRSLENVVPAAVASSDETPLPISSQGRLYQNYPNPFALGTSINYSLSKAGHVSLIVYDVLGREVQRLVDQALPAGDHTVEFMPQDLPSGIYLYRLQTSSEQMSRQMMLLR